MNSSCCLQCPQLLYRLRNGELADALQAKVFWILIGTNDHGGDHCSGDTIVAGNIQIVQEILAQRPNAIVVLNSILPRANPGSDLYSNDNSRQWQTLTRVNQWLECYANENERVEFFNATDIFLQPSTTLTIPEYYSDPVHPSAAGHSQWAIGIVGKLLDLIQS